MKLYFAPMEGITGYVFRNAYAACYGGVDAFFTPFLSNPVLNQIELHDILPENNQGIRVIPQILTNRPETFEAIATTLKDYGYPEVNLNLGCPSGTVVAKGRGAGALREPRTLDRLLYGIFEKSPLPLSVKCRIGIFSEAEWEDILEVLLKYPMTELIIHPRVQKQFYNGEVHMEAFRTAYRQIVTEPFGSAGDEDASHAAWVAAGDTRGEASLRLCYNGDIRTPADLSSLLSEYPGVSAVMLGRGLLWDPELAERYLKTAAAPDLSKSSDAAAAPDLSKVRVVPDRERLRRFLGLLYDGYKKEMGREGPALMKLKELWKYLQVYTGHTPQEMRPLWKARTLPEYRDVVSMLV